MEFPNTFFRFLLKRFRIRSKICIFIPKELIRYFPCQQNTNIRLFMNRFADQIHPHTGTDRCNIKGSKDLNYRFQRGKHIFFCDNDFLMVTSDILCHLSCIFQINSVLAHTDSKSFNWFLRFFCCDCTDQRRIQTTRKKEPNFCISYQSFFYTSNQFVMNISANHFQIIC